MSLSLKVNFLKGWPNPYILDHVSKNTTTLTNVDEGKIATRDSAGKWVVGALATGDKAKVPYILWNGSARDGDNSHAFPSTAAAPTAGYAQVGYGGIQGIALLNAIEVETAQIDATYPPAFGDSIGVTATGNVRTAQSGDLIVGTCTHGAHTKPGGISMITFIPDNSKRVA